MLNEIILLCLLTTRYGESSLSASSLERSYLHSLIDCITISYSPRTSYFPVHSQLNQGSCFEYRISGLLRSCELRNHGVPRNRIAELDQNAKG
ncbi:hypothetical protein F5050DRAFT_325410 [Lentinula boryana]|uniref:Secreted protein n=1 Tax=Lentinula boryana TaxID=40481 RepID=A0ABQ8QA34_9AGAR|nr:hypothetical protein F5050DRAFT_325410 [Lentinula boryana]